MKRPEDAMSTSVATSLNTLLADTTVFYQKLRHYHWNVQGREFFELHLKFEEIYNKWVVFIDEIAERIIALDTVPLHTLDSMLEHATLKEDEEIPAAREMVNRTIADLLALRDSIDKTIGMAEDTNDRTSVNILDAVRDGLEADLWMLKTWLKQA
jgi:starvation-inducible DNA-binding protein